jgi:hypothetical protein
MPRILSRSELLPQMKPLHWHGSRSLGRNGNVVSPTISAFPSVASSAKSRCAGLSYKIEERRDLGGQQDAAESRGDDNDTWGYFVDFTSPQCNNAEQRKSSTLQLLDRIDVSR